MTIEDIDGAPHLSQRRFTLATDLDGTFLGGTSDDRNRLYGWIEDNRDTVGLIFVTGRDPEFILDMCSDRDLPWPDYVVGDVGTTIARVERADRRIAPIVDLETEIAERWRDRGAVVRAALDGHPGLQVQTTAFRYRVSYDLNPQEFDASAVDKVSRLGLDSLISDNKFFDVLPTGVSKGPSLRRLIAHLSVPEERVLAAGDTMNDLSMLTCGLKAVAVGNSEEALVEAIGNRGEVHMARAHGAGGILEAIDAFQLHDIPERERYAI